ncbi:unnamed protein product, partial [Boreogadus saida]
MRRWCGAASTCFSQARGQYIKMNPRPRHCYKMDAKVCCVSPRRDTGSRLAELGLAAHKVASTQTRRPQPASLEVFAFVWLVRQGVVLVAQSRLTRSEPLSLSLLTYALCLVAQHCDEALWSIASTQRAEHILSLVSHPILNFLYRTRIYDGELEETTT